MTYTIKYQYGTYSGTETVQAEDGEQAIAKMWSQFRRLGYLNLPMAYKSAKVINEEEE
ncbi:MAG: hypothetical protein JRJ57_00290 [Deltaproteobacteria bacterium]|nr:hypothetical protein [Deltaproteobacteria bacterium]